MAADNKKMKIAHYASTGLFSLMLGAGGLMYFIQYDTAVEAWTPLGFPLYLIYPLGVAKILGVLALWQRKNELVLVDDEGGVITSQKLERFSKLLVLVGKDGSVKYRADQFSPETVFATIDRMPMRRAEMNR